MLAIDKVNTNPSSSSLDSSHSVWKKIWKIQAPNKIWHFIWRVAKDSSPIKQNLKSQHILVDETCSLCDDHQETVQVFYGSCGSHDPTRLGLLYSFVFYYRLVFMATTE